MILKQAEQWPLRCAVHANIPIDELNTYDEDFDPSEPYHAQKMNQLRSEGGPVRTPLSVAVDKGLAVVMDGSHRRQWGNETGASHLPVNFFKPQFDIRQDDRAAPVGPAVSQWLSQNKVI